jgi:hypothetical protein
MPSDPFELADARIEPPSVMLSLDDLRSIVADLQEAVRLLAMRPNVPDADDAVNLNNSETLLRRALARLPGWLLEEMS